MKIGDSVSVIDQNIRGQVKKMEKNLILIEDEHGFEYRFSPQELVIHQNLYDNTAIETKDKNTFNPTKKSPPIPTLDLHLSALPKKIQSVKGAERLFLQKVLLQDFLDKQMQLPVSKVSIIHGIGDGIVQKMVYEVLQNRADVEFDEDGFFYHETGAVNVYLRKN